MRYDVRTGAMEPFEPQPHVPGWAALGRAGYDLRIGDAERDATIAKLREHFAAGRLTLEELTERIDGALAAKTQGHIDALLGDLPRLRAQWPPATQPAQYEPSDTGRYLVLMLLLFAIAAWLLMMAFMAYRTGTYQ
ncbi:MAG TPA: DUF1707 domain-containing protein [Streptosporangiaceae bacterium]|jgi:hypothetical protein